MMTTCIPKLGKVLLATHIPNTNTGELKQYSIITSPRHRLSTLMSLLVQYAGKIIVFMSSCASVDFHHDVFAGAEWPPSPDVLKQKVSSGKKLPGGFVGLGDIAENPDSGEDDIARNSDEDAHSKQSSKKRKKKGGKQRRTDTYNVGGFLGMQADGEEPGAAVEHSENRMENEKTRIFDGIGIFKLHGNLSADERRGFLKDFEKSKRAVLLASDVVARGIDLPKIDWIVQYDPPQHLEEYLHRIGRTARCGNAGNSVIFLQSSEEGYLHLLREKMSNTETTDTQEFTIHSWNAEALRQQLRFSLPQRSPLLKIRNLPDYVNAQMTKKVSASDELSCLARRAFLSWVKAYSTFPKTLKPIFSVRALHPGHVASSFCLAEAPKQIAQRSKRDADFSSESRLKRSVGKKNAKKSTKIRLADRLAATKCTSVPLSLKKNGKNNKVRRGDKK